MGSAGNTVRPVLEARKIPLVEDGAFRDDSLLGGGVVELPALVAWRITDKNALLHVGAQRAALVLLHMHIGHTPPNAQMGDIRLAAIEGLIGGLARQCRGWGAVEDVYQSRESFAPERGR